MIQNHWVSIAITVVVVATFLLALLSTYGVLNVGVGANNALYAVASLMTLVLIIKIAMRCCMTREMEFK